MLEIELEGNLEPTRGKGVSSCQFSANRRPRITCSFVREQRERESVFATSGVSVVYSRENKRFETKGEEGSRKMKSGKFLFLDEERSVPSEVCHRFCRSELEQTAIVLY